MTNANDLYYNRVMGKTIDELRDDASFQQDLVTFFQSDRHGYSGDKIRERGVDGLLEDFAEHMRYQENNEVSALRDLYFASGKEDASQGQRDAFGRLMAAWDNSSGTDMSFDKAFDYFESIASAPSTWATVASAGAGKIAARAGVKGAAIATRRAVAATIARESVGQSVARGAARGAIAEGAQAAALESINQGTRVRSIEDYDFDVGDVAIAGVAGGVFGGAAGAAARVVSNTQANKAIDALEESGMNFRRIAAEKAQAASATVKRADPMYLKSFIDDLYSYSKDATEIATGAHKSARSKGLDALPKGEVEAGEIIRRAIMNPNDPYSKVYSIGGLNSDAIQGIAAAYIDLRKAFDPNGNKRISQIVAEAIRSGDFAEDGVGETIRKAAGNIGIDPDKLTNARDLIKAVQDKYGISADEFSHLYMAELSNAAKLFNFQSQMVRKLGGRGGDKAARATAEAEKLERVQNKFDAIVADARELFKRRVSTVTDQQVDEIAAQAQKNTNGFVEFARNADAMRIAFMTSQLATTAANVTFSMGRLGVDVVDTMFYNAIRGKNPFKGTFSTVAALTTDRRMVEVLDLMIDDEAPDYVAKYLTDVSRAEGQTGSGLMAKYGRLVNYFNGLTDKVFKNAMFYSSLDRHLSELGDETIGTSVEGFIRSGRNFGDIPEDLVRKAVDDSLRFTFQRSYYGEKTMFAKGAQAVFSMHKKVPLLISSSMPFPRFVANQLEFFHDYMPGLGALGMIRDLRNGAVPTKNMAERVSRQITGTALLGAAYAFRAQQGTETKWNQYIDEDGRVQQLERIAGPMNAFLVIADAIYRYRNDEELDVSTYKLGAELAEQLGTTGFIPDSAPVVNLLKALTTGESNASVNNLLPDLIATFTYPLASVRDIYGQIDPRSSMNPYTKDVTGGEMTVSLFDIMEFEFNKGAGFTSRATRFLPDVPWVQVNTSIDGQYDLEYWNMFSGKQIQSVDPMTKQFTGRNVSPELSELQRDMNRYGIDEYDAYRGNANPSLDYAVRYYMANVYDLPKRWEEFKSENADVLDQATPEFVRDRLSDFLSQSIEAATSKVREDFERRAVNDPASVRGYIRNVFVAKMRQMKREGRTDPNDLFSAYLVRTGKEAMSINDYIYNADSLEGQLSRMEEVSGVLDNIQKSGRNFSEPK